MGAMKGQRGRHGVALARVNAFQISFNFFSEAGVETCRCIRRTRTSIPIKRNDKTKSCLSLEENLTLLRLQKAEATLHK